MITLVVNIVVFDSIVIVVITYDVVVCAVAIVVVNHEFC